MLRIAVVDEDEVSLHLIRLILEKIEGVQSIACFSCPLEALALISQLNIDAVFLEGDMSGLNGIELANALRQNNKHLEVVFVAAHERYAVDAFKLNAVHYILKPIAYEMVENAVQRLIDKSRSSKLESSPDPGFNPSLRFQLFGGFSIYKSNQEVIIKWPTSKTEELFALLLVYCKSGISKWKLMDLLWSEASPQKAQQNLYTTMFRLKKALAASGLQVLIEKTGGRYQVSSDQLSIDYFEFMHFLNQRIDQVTVENESAFVSALSIYSGDLFGDRGYDWSIPLREYCYELYLEKTKSLAEYYSRTEQLEKASKLSKEVIRNCC